MCDLCDRKMITPLSGSIISTEDAIDRLDVMAELYRRKVRGSYAQRIADPVRDSILKAAPFFDDDAGDGDVIRAAGDLYGMLVDVLDGSDLRPVGDDLAAGMISARLAATIAVLGPMEGNELGEQFVSGP